MSNFEQSAQTIEAILAARSEIALALGDEWPAFEAQLWAALAQLEAAEDDEIEHLVTELLFLAWETPAFPIFRRIMQATQSESAVREVSRSASPFHYRQPKTIDDTPSLSGDEFRAGVRRVHERRLRYLNAGFFTMTGDSVAAERPLTLDDAYQLGVNIGPFWGLGSPEQAPFPEDAFADLYETYDGLTVDILVATTDMVVTQPHQKLALTKQGVTETLYFPLTIAESGRKVVTVEAYFHGHLLQVRRLEVDVVSQEAAPLSESAWLPQDSTITFTRMAQLTAEMLEPMLTHPRRLTIAVEHSPEQQQIALRFRNREMDLDVMPSTLTELSLNELLTAVRGQLLTMMDAYQGTVGGLFDLADPTANWDGRWQILTKQLGQLAAIGRNFFLQLFPSLEDWERPSAQAQRLWRALEPNSVIQVAPLSANQPSVPWEALYQWPVDEYRLGRTRLCGRFWEHGSRFSDCPHHDDPEVVCPHGFWGYRYIIEQMPCQVDRDSQPIQANMPLQVRNRVPLQFLGLVYPAFPKLEEHWTNLATLTTEWTMTKAEQFDDIKAMLKRENGADMLYFYAHGGVDERQVPYLKVGADDKITEVTLNSWRLNWQAQQPLVVLNTCESADYRPDSFNNLIRFFWRRGAAGVIGTQCQVKEKLADAFIRPFLVAFLRQETAGKALFAARRDLLHEYLDPRGLTYSLFAAAEVRLAQPIVVED